MKKTLFLLLVLSVVSSLVAQEGIIPMRPEPAQFVNDYAELIAPEQEALLEEKLKSFAKQTTNQFAIAVIPSLKGNNLEQLANQWFKAWGIGQKDKNNGLLILVAKEDRKMRIEVGYGLEATITNAEATKVIDTYLKPNFKNGDYYKGLDEATNYLISLTANATENQASAPTSNTPTPVNQSTDTYEQSYNYGSFIKVGLATCGIVSMIVWIGFRFMRFNKEKKKKSKPTTSSQYKKSTSNYYKSSNNQNNNYTTGYVGYDSSSSSSYDSSSSSSSDSSSSFGGGDSGGGGSSGDW